MAAKRCTSSREGKVLLSCWISEDLRMELDRIWAAQGLRPHGRTQQGMEQMIASYPNLEEVVWVQEEPRNQGAWSVMRRRLPELLPEGVKLEYIGRQGRASPGEGYSVSHVREQERIVLTALTRGA